MKPCRMIGALVAALLVLMAAGCGANEGTTTSATSATTVPQTTATADEYDVYSALIQSVYIDATQPKQIVISGSTVSADQNVSFGDAAGAIKSFVAGPWRRHPG
jgi:ABC-type glycerol-3-phosphate transport system substrate-binding protein